MQTAAAASSLENGMGMGRASAIAALVLGLGMSPQGQEPPPPADALTVIGAQLEAFNAHDVEGLVGNLASDFVWYAVDTGGTAVEMRGREEFRRSIESYFAAFPQARAELDGEVGGGQFVAVRERAFWPDGRGGEQSQSSLAVYEVRGGLIRTVWYYPAEADSE